MDTAVMTQAKLQVPNIRRKKDIIFSNAVAQDLGSRSIDKLVGAVGELSGADCCYSVLVETG